MNQKFHTLIGHGCTCATKQVVSIYASTKQELLNIVVNDDGTDCTIDFANGQSIFIKDVNKSPLEITILK